MRRNIDEAKEVERALKFLSGQNHHCAKSTLALATIFEDGKNDISSRNENEKLLAGLDRLVTCLENLNAVVDHFLSTHGLTDDSDWKGRFFNKYRRPELNERDLDIFLKILGSSQSKEMSAESMERIKYYNDSNQGNMSRRVFLGATTAGFTGLGFSRYIAGKYRSEIQTKPTVEQEDELHAKKQYENLQKDKNVFVTTTPANAEALDTYKKAYDELKKEYEYAKAERVSTGLPSWLEQLENNRKTDIKALVSDIAGNTFAAIGIGSLMGYIVTSGYHRRMKNAYTSTRIEDGGPSDAIYFNEQMGNLSAKIGSMKANKNISTQELTYSETPNVDTFIKYVLEQYKRKYFSQDQSDRAP